MCIGQVTTVLLSDASFSALFGFCFENVCYQVVFVYHLTTLQISLLAAQTVVEYAMIVSADDDQCRSLPQNMLRTLHVKGI